MSYVRRANFAGSWYEGSHNSLDAFLTRALDTAKSHNMVLADSGVRAIISPHAGYSYSGGVAGSAYCNINPDEIDRVFVLGPSHRIALDGCALSGATRLETPIGDMDVDLDTINELDATGKFFHLKQGADEDEHSMELQYPFLRKVMGSSGYKVVPIMVGSIRASKEKEYGRILAPYLDDPRTLFVISSDFCHWGSRFDYTYYNRDDGAIDESIEALDRQGMRLIENGGAEAFTKYLKDYGNTICGRHPIGVLLQTMAHTSKNQGQIKFVDYKQSSRCKSHRDSSVSYAAGVLLS